MEKTYQAKADQQEKGAPYRADPLFTYLWDCKYGTSAYKANPLTRFLDNWVARLCDFQSARKNYWMLQEIPERLDEHAKALRSKADATFFPAVSTSRAGIVPTTTTRSRERIPTRS